MLTGILLAAGESRRMGYPKQLLKIRNETFVEHLVKTMLAITDRLVVVVGANTERVRAAIPPYPRIEITENPNYALGQLSSIQVGIRAIEGDPEITAAMVHLVDHPMVKIETFRAVATSYRTKGAPIVIARHDGRRGHPVLFDRSVFSELLVAPQDQGARVVVNADPSRIVYADVNDGGILLDLDTPYDLERAGLGPIPSK
jgi:molybdenum cofactor cytidylyltransferase